MTFSETALQQARERRFLISRLDAWIFRTIEPHIGRRVLEVGCGTGNLTGFLASRDLVVGVDISSSSVRQVNQMFAHLPHVSAITADAADRSILELKNLQFDTIVSLNVLEHIEDDSAALRLAHELLTPGGRIVLIVPAHQLLYGTMDSSIGHYRRYSRSGVLRVLQRAGFANIRTRYMNPLGMLGWIVNGRIFHRSVAPSGQLRLFNALVPLVSAVDSLIQWPFGLSVLAVGERAV